MGEYFNNTFDNWRVAEQLTVDAERQWSGDFFEAKKAFPGRRFQCDLENREEVKGNKSWQGARYVDDYKPWNKVNYDTIDWASCFNDCRTDKGCDFKCEPCEPCDFKCEPCEPCDFKCEPCEPCEKSCDKEDANWNKNRYQKKDRKFWNEKADYVHWTEDKDIWPHDYLPTVGEKRNL